MGDSIPEFRSHLGGTTSGDRGPTDIFRRNAPAMTSSGFCGPLGQYSPGVADPRRRPSQKAVKRKIAGDAAVPYERGRIQKQTLSQPAMSLMLQAQDDLSVVVEDLVHVRGRQARLAEIEEILPVRLER